MVCAQRLLFQLFAHLQFCAFLVSGADSNSVAPPPSLVLSGVSRLGSLIQWLLFRIDWLHGPWLPPRLLRPIPASCFSFVAALPAYWDRACDYVDALWDFTRFEGDGCRCGTTHTAALTLSATGSATIKPCWPGTTPGSKTILTTLMMSTRTLTVALSCRGLPCGLSVLLPPPVLPPGGFATELGMGLSREVRLSRRVTKAMTTCLGRWYLVSARLTVPVRWMWTHRSAAGLSAEPSVWRLSWQGGLGVGAWVWVRCGLCLL